LKRVADFLEVFVPQCHDDWLIKWIPKLSETLIRKCMDTPRIPRIYLMLKTLMHTCSKHKFFEKTNAEQTQSEKMQIDEGNDEENNQLD